MKTLKLSLVCSSAVILILGISHSARADADLTHLLLKPESGLITTPLDPSDVTLAPQVDGVSFSFADPQILFQQTTDQAEFISAAWKDAAGKLIHQRDVFILKAQYGIVIDYAYGQDQHTITRDFTFANGPVTLDQLVAQTKTSDGQYFQVQAVDVSPVTPSPSANGQGITYTTSETLPCPLPTVLLLSKTQPAPKVEFIKPGNHMIVKCKVTFPDGRIDYFGLAWESRLIHTNEKPFHGWVAWLTDGPAGSSSFEIK